MTNVDLNHKKWVKVLANTFLICVTFIIFAIFLVLNKYSEVYEVTKAYKRITIELNSPFINGGIILSIGLFMMLISKLLKSNILVILFGILTLITFYIKMLWIGI